MQVRLIDQFFWICSAVIIAITNSLIIYYAKKYNWSLFGIWGLAIGCYFCLSLTSFLIRYKYILGQYKNSDEHQRFQFFLWKGKVSSIKIICELLIIVFFIALFIYFTFSSGLLMFRTQLLSGKSEIYLLLARIAGGICFFVFTFPIIILLEMFYIYLLRISVSYKNLRDKKIG